MVITSQHLSAKIGGRAEEDAEETAYFESMVNDPMRLEEAVSTVGQVDERLTFFVREAIEARLPQH